MSYRITRVRCPECQGSGNGKLLGLLPCPCCLGERKATKLQLLRRARVLETLGEGGYITGDLDFEDLTRYRAEVRELRKLADGLGVTAQAG